MQHTIGQLLASTMSPGVSQGVCHCDPLELSPHDAGLEDRRLPGGRQHGGPQTSSGGQLTQTHTHTKEVFAGY